MAANTLRATTIVWGFGICCIIGFVSGLFLKDYGTFEWGKWVGKREAIGQYDQMKLVTCARMLRNNDLKHSSQRDVCAEVVERALVASGFAHLVPGENQNDL